MVFYGKKRGIGKKRVQRRKRVYRPKVSRALKSYIKRTVHNNIENKSIINYGANLAITTSVNGVVPSTLNLVPTIAQGTSNSQRTGNEVKITKAYLRGFVNLLPYNATSNPMISPLWVKMFLVRSKYINTNLISQTDINSSFLNGGASNIPLQGNTLDMLFDVNRDTWTLLATKTFKIGQTAFNGTSGDTPTGDNSPMSQRFYFNFTKHLKRPLKYPDGSNVCQNNNLFLVTQVVRADGVTALANQQPAEFHYFMEHQYEDA